MTWSRSTKLLLLAGCLAAVISVSGVMTGFSEGVIRTMLADYYPGPCTGTPPTGFSITYEGQSSGCTGTNGIQCIAGEEIVFTASATGYTPQVCDRFVWTLGDGRTIETFGPDLRTRLDSPGPRTVGLRVINPGGEFNVPAVTLGAPAPTTCNANNDIRRLCLLGNRFRVTLRAEDPRTGRFGEGQAVPESGTDVFGYFSIPALTNNPNNLEVFVKIVDATSIGAGFWIFYGGLTDLEYTLTVFDTRTGLAEEYFKEGLTSQAGFDTSAFQGPHVQPPPPGSCNGVPQVTTPADVDPGTCTPGTNTLCLLGGRFRVTMTARDVGRTGQLGNGQAVSKGQEFGWFSVPIFAPTTDPQFFVKMLDARVISNTFWIFYSGLTDMEVVLTVTDMTNGNVRVYTRPAVGTGTPCGAFDTAIPVTD